MSRLLRQNHKYFVLSFILLFFIGGRPVEFGQEGVFFQGFQIPKPIVRVALGTNLDDISVRASSGMKIYRVGDTYRLLSGDASEARIRGRRESLSEKFSVQVLAARRQVEAEDFARDLRSRIPERVYVQEGRTDGGQNVFHVRVGDFLTRGDALAFITRLSRFGVFEAWIIREEVAGPGDSPRWVLVNDELIDVSRDAALFLIPANPQSFLSYGGRSFRGIMILRGSRQGIVLVNVLGLEDYLKGVVPAELSPYDFGALEALKAQAVAARTYALKSLGQFEELGFDLYATPASQVYEGLDAEHPLSSRAVEETRGQVATYGGRLINALYTSTCGGATEDAENVFEGLPVPYLRSTECVLEREAVWTLEGSREPLPAVFAGPASVPDLALLGALGVVRAPGDPRWLRDAAPGEEVAGWVRRAAAAAGREAPRLAPPSRLSRADLARLIVEAFGWGDRVSTLVGPAESEHALKDEAGLAAADKRPLAYALIAGLLPPDGEPAGSEPEVSRADAAAAIARALAQVREFRSEGSIAGFRDGKLLLDSGGTRQERPLDPQLLLTRCVDGAVSSAAQAEIAAGDLVRWVERDGRITLCELQALPISNVLDQPSRFHRWDVRISRADLEARINAYYPVGRLVDLVVRRRGASRRVVDLDIVGQAGQVRVTGLRIRQVLNLRDTLFVIEREKDADGTVGHFLFSGKGWGHGVGLCQVGAFRMARMGATYDEILKKYYRGIKIQTWP